MKTQKESLKDVDKVMNEFISAFLWDNVTHFSDERGARKIEKWLREHGFNFAMKAIAAALGQGFTPDDPRDV